MATLLVTVCLTPAVIASNFAVDTNPTIAPDVLKKAGTQVAAEEEPEAGAAEEGHQIVVVEAIVEDEVDVEEVVVEEVIIKFTLIKVSIIERITIEMMNLMLKRENRTITTNNVKLNVMMITT